MNLTSHDLPHLQGTSIPAFAALQTQVWDQQQNIEDWFQGQWQQTPPPFYASVDLRNSGFKITPVDTNLFPAGFNNLDCNYFDCTGVSQASKAVQNYLEHYYPDNSKNILLIPENHTRNKLYLENVGILQLILSKAGYNVRIGSLLEDLTTCKKIDLPSGRHLDIQPIKRRDTRIYVENFDPHYIILNHDLAEGIPEILKDIEQPIIPPLLLGWSTRLKSEHFAHYQNVSKAFADFLKIDPWLINPYFDGCNKVNFMTREGESCLVEHGEKLYEKVVRKYEEYAIPAKPFIVVKAERGTYGMGVLMVDNPAALGKLNRKDRTRMSATKGGQAIDQVILQEGVPTIETIGAENWVAEPVIYHIGPQTIGGFYRAHPQRSISENLNMPGMQFVPFALEHKPQTYFYSVIARLAVLAAAHEMTGVKAL